MIADDSPPNNPRTILLRCALGYDSPHELDEHLLEHLTATYDVVREYALLPAEEVTDRDRARAAHIIVRYDTLLAAAVDLLLDEAFPS